jgi:diguanylate cyclase (GGDEF)-like protein
MRDLLIRHGLLKSTLAITILSIFISLLITIGLSELSGEGSSFVGISIAVIAPGVIAPVCSLIFVRLLIQLDATEKQLRELTRRDSLTGVYNRAYFIELAERELARTKRYGNIFSIAILDVDEFKQVNDVFGHLAGDKVLQLMTQACLNNLRRTDTIARFGGDEFVILFPYAGKVHVMECIERIRTILAGSPIYYEGNEISYTVSAGAATYDQSQTELDSLFRKADIALYEAKGSGKNKVIVV